MSRRISSSVFVGRRAELDQLNEAFRRASEGQPSLVLIAGEAGVGKSRFMAEFSASVEASGVRILTGSCLDLGEGSLPYAPFAEALRRVARELQTEDRVAAFGGAPAELVNLVPDLASAQPASAPLEDSLAGRQARLFDAIIGVLGRLAADRSAVLALEDLHWADGSTRDLIRFLVRNLRSERLLVLASYRSDDLHRRHSLMPLLSELERSDRVEHIDLRRFDRDEVAEQLTGILGQQPTTEQLDALLDRSDGIAFYIEELVASDNLDRSTIPTSLRNVLEHRLALLSNPTLEVVSAASVIGGRFRHEQLVALSDHNELALQNALREAIDAGIIEPVKDPEAITYVFRHALLREAAYDDLLPTARVRLHGRLADHLSNVLAAHGNADVSLVAEFAIHTYQAQDEVRALDGSVRAVLALADSAAYAEALEHGERALELWSQAPDSNHETGMDRPELLLRTSAIAANAGRLDRAVALGQEAVHQLQGAPDRDRLAAALADVARYAWETGDFAIGNSAAEQANGLIGEGGAPSLTAFSVLSVLGFVRLSQGRLLASAQLLREAMSAATAIGNRRAWAAAAGSLAETLVLMGRPGRAADVADEAAAAMADGSAETWEMYGSAGRGFAMWMAGRFEDSARMGREGLEWANRYGLTERQGQYDRMTMAEAFVELGRYDEVEVLARPFLVGNVATPAGTWIIQASARAAIARGRLDEARRSLDRQDVIRSMIANDVWRLELEIELARAQGRFDAVRAMVVDAIAIASVGELRSSMWRCLALGVGAAADRAAAASSRRRTEEASDAKSQARDWLGLLRGIVEDADADGGAGPFWHAALTTAEAEVTRCEGASDEALWANAAQGWTALRHPRDEAYAQLRQAEAILGARGGRAEAEAPLRMAHATAGRIGAAPLQAEVETMARRASIDLADPSRQTINRAEVAASEPPGLTARERDVLRFVAAGHTNREIGDRLFISEKTVSVHVSNAMAKLGALSRYEAAASAERLGELG